MIHSEKFCAPPDQWAALERAFPALATPEWKRLLSQPFSPGQLLDALLAGGATPAQTRPAFDAILGRADKIQDAAHGEGYWVDHWIYNLDLIDSYAAVYPDRMRALLVERRDFGSFDNAHVVQPRDKKYVLRKDGSVRQLHAVAVDAGKAWLIAQRTQDPQKLRAAHGKGAIYRTSLLGKIVGLLAVKASLLDPFGIGLEIEAEKPGWCDALNGLPGLFGSSTHEAFALQRWAAFARSAVRSHLSPAGELLMPVEVSAFVHSLTDILARADLRNFAPSWHLLATRREAFRAETLLGVAGDEAGMTGEALLQFLDAIDRVLENESVFLHMHYKFLLETLRSGLAEEFFDDLRRGLVAFRDPAQYGRSPLENSSFIASSRFADAASRGAGFVARLSGATAEWISMVLHMGLGATPFRLVDGALRFEPEPTIAGWLFTEHADGPFVAGSFGLRLFGTCWIVYVNPQRRDTFGAPRLAPSAFDLEYRDGLRVRHEGSWLPESLALDLRAGLLARVDVALADVVSGDQPALAAGALSDSR